MEKITNVTQIPNRCQSGEKRCLNKPDVIVEYITTGILEIKGNVAICESCLTSWREYLMIHSEAEE